PAAFGVPGNVNDPAFAPRDAARFREAPEEGRVQAGIELERVREPGERVLRVGGRPGEPVRARREDGQRVILQLVAGDTRPARTQPVVVEGHAGDVLAESAERVQVAIAEPAPVVELDAELEGGAGAGHEV